MDVIHVFAAWHLGKNCYFVISL